MPKLPRLTARQITAVQEKVGFSLARQRGSFTDQQTDGRTPALRNPNR
jgi:predicted RNA binding protein YcfA (HicA-like mRNA interferase family)